MASLYNLEPQPTAKAILRTTTGDLTLELFAKQTPLASRNFLQHCLDGYYNGTIFHRLVSGFIIQGGDPTGTGSGGESAINNGEPFQDEFHSRLKFNRRGLLGMANEGSNSNGSQFFLTLGATPELQGKHTLFGRIEGDTIYNLMKMAEAELTEGEGSERPLYPTKVTGAEVLVNPFEDMVARVKEAPRVQGKDEGRGKEAKKRKKPAGKNVLSFGVGEEGDEEAAPVMVKKAKVNPKMVSVGVEETKEGDGGETGVKAKEKKLKKKSPSPPSVPQEAPVKNQPPLAKPAAEDTDSDSEPEPEEPKQSALDKTNAEIAAIKASMKRKVDAAPAEKAKPKSALEAMIPETSTRGRKRGKATDEKGAMDIFNAFKQQLEDMPAPSEPAADKQSAANESHDQNASTNGTSASAGADEDEEADLCDLHFIANCQSCKAWNDPAVDGEEEDDGAGDWMSHKLSFAKDTLGKDLEWKKQMEEFEVIDPREKARVIKEEIRRERDERKGKGKSRK